MEEWKDVKGYEELYEVSNKGNLKSKDMSVLCRGGKRRNVSGKLLNKRYCPNGYVQYVLCKDGVKKYVYAHHLVSLTFITNPLNYPQINHKDEIKHNNSVDNLEWCTQSYNNTYGTRIPRVTETRLRNDIGSKIAEGLKRRKLRMQLEACNQ